MGVKIYSQLSKDIVVEKDKIYNKVLLKEYVEKFEILKDKGIIRNRKFNDDIWEIFNEVYYRTLRFNIDEISFLREKQNRNLSYNYSDIIYSLKIFMLIKLKNESLSNLYAHFLFMVKVINNTCFFNKDKANNLIKQFKNGGDGRTYAKFIYEYIKFFAAICTNQRYIEILEYYRFNQRNVNKKSRELPFLESAFRLSDIINDLVQYMPNLLKEQYFPILLWWKITTVIPLRKTEFLLIPKNCIEYKDNKYYLTVRRTLLKEAKGYQIKHSLEDYYLDKIEINNEIYSLIEEYLNLVEHYDGVENFYQNDKFKQIDRKFLISYRSYYNFKKRYQKKYIPKYEIFTSQNFDRLLEKFYKNIVPLYGYRVIPKIKTLDIMLEENQIEKINPGDTRHLAIINMILQGVSPIVLKEFCGQNDINSSINYYDHLPTFIRCYTYNLSNKIILYRDQYRDKNIDIDIEALNNSVSYFNNIDLKYKNTFLKEENYIYRKCNGGRGKCISNNYNRDCVYVSGICEAGCQYYIPEPNNKDVYDRIEMLNDSIDIQVDILKRLIKDARYIKNIEEQYGCQMNKIKSLMNQLALVLANSID